MRAEQNGDDGVGDEDQDEGQTESSRQGRALGTSDEQYKDDDGGRADGN